MVKRGSFFFWKCLKNWMRTHIDIRNIPVCKQKQDWSAMCCKAKTLSVKRWRNARKNFAWISILFVFASERGISYVCLIHHQHRVPSESIFSRDADDLIRYTLSSKHIHVGWNFFPPSKLRLEMTPWASVAEPWQEKPFDLFWFLSR